MSEVLIGRCIINHVQDKDGSSILTLTARVIDIHPEYGVLVEDINDKDCHWYVKPSNALTPSRGSIIVKEGYEYFYDAGVIYKAHVRNPLNEQGYRSNAVYECLATEGLALIRRLRF